MGCSTIPVSGPNGAGSCGAAGVVPNVVAIGKRASCAAETALGCTGGGCTGRDCTGGDEGAARDPPAVPQPDARATIASAMTGMAAFALPAVRQRGQSNRELSRIYRPRDTESKRLNAP